MLDVWSFLWPFRLLPFIAVCVSSLGEIALSLVLARCVIAPEADGLFVQLAMEEVA